MVAALTTAAVINHSAYPPKEYVSWTVFAPSRKTYASQSSGELTESQRQQIHDHNVRVLEMTARLKAEQCQTNSQSFELSSTPSNMTP